MFRLEFDVENDDCIIHMEFDTASDFLEQCENDDIPFDYKLSNITYGWEDIEENTVEGLYYYFCENL